MISLPSTFPVRIAVAILVTFFALGTSAQAASRAPQIVRNTLTNEEAAAPIAFSVSVKMRNMAELQARIDAGEHISQAEMEARYLPLQSDYDQVKAWLVGQGFAENQLV